MIDKRTIRFDDDGRLLDDKKRAEVMRFRNGRLLHRLRHPIGSASSEISRNRHGLVGSLSAKTP